MNSPVEYNFPDHYKGDGLTDFTMTFKYKSGAFVDLEGCIVRMQLREFGKELLHEFSSDSDKEDQKLTLLPDGVVEFPRIKELNIRSTVCWYDLSIEDTTGFVRTYMKGKWKINQDITI